MGVLNRGATWHEAAKSRFRGILFAIFLGLCWIGAGQSDPLPRNPAGDAVAERFASSGHADGSESVEYARGRMNFAPRFAVFFSPLPGDLDGPQTAPQRAPTAIEAPQNSQSDGSDLQVVAGGADDLGVVLIRKLPAGSQLSVGTRLSASVWALSRADLRNVVVNLPPGRHGPIRAEIEVYGRAGSPAGTMIVEIRENRRVRSAKPRRSHEIHTVSVSKQKQPKPAISAPKTVPQQTPSAVPAATANAQAAPIANPFPPLLFLPGPITTPAPAVRDTAGHQIMLNLGVTNRDAPPLLGLQQ